MAARVSFSQRCFSAANRVLMHVPNLHPLERLLHRLGDCIWRRRGWFLYPQLVLFGVCLVFAARSLEFRTSRNDLVSADEAYQRHWLQLKREFEVQEDLVTLIESDDLEKNRQFVERLAARLAVETSLFKDIFFKGDLRTMGPKALLFLPQERLEQVRRAVRDYGPLISKFSEVNNLSSLFAEVNAQMRAAKPEQVSGEPLTKSLPALMRIADQATASLERPGVPPSPGITALFAGSRKTEAGEYVSFAGGRFYLLTCAARKELLEAAAILRLRELVREIQMPDCEGCEPHRIADADHQAGCGFERPANFAIADDEYQRHDHQRNHRSQDRVRLGLLHLVETQHGFARDAHIHTRHFHLNLAHQFAQPEDGGFFQQFFPGGAGEQVEAASGKIDVFAGLGFPAPRE